MKMKLEPVSADAPILVMTRTLAAPRDVVWTVFTDPKHVKKWYGGHGFENPVCEMDVRPGGKWRHVMRTPDGKEYAMEFVFVEVVKPEKLVWQDADRGARPHDGRLSSLMTVTLEDAGKETKWRLVARFSSIADRDLAIQIGFATVIGEGCEKFDELLKGLVA